MGRSRMMKDRNEKKTSPSLSASHVKLKKIAL